MCSAGIVYEQADAACELLTKLYRFLYTFFISHITVNGKRISAGCPELITQLSCRALACVIADTDRIPIGSEPSAYG